MRDALPALLVLLALAALSAAAAQPAPAARQVSIVVYHVHPDPAAGTPRADPFSSPLAAGFSSGGRLPATRVDGVLFASDAPEGDPGSAAAHFREVRGLVQERQRAGGVVPLVLDVALGADRVVARVEGEGAARAVLVEDALPFDGGSGVTLHRFVARAALAGNGSVLEAPLDPAWARARLGVVAWVATPTGEVLQSASWLAGDASPVRQEARAVLVEHATASWCEPCGASDQALALLASQYGFPPPDVGAGSVAPRLTLPLVAGLAAGAGSGVLLLRRRAA